MKNDALKKYDRMLRIACEALAGYASEEPCGTLFFISEEREKCDKYCHKSDADVECWRRYLELRAGEDSDAE